MRDLNSKTPLVTIAMPFYNCEDTLGDSLRSILWQTYQNWELLLCDDGSTDGSLEKARSFSDKRIVLWSDGRNKKLPVRLNECIARARGKYFARMDADDIAYPQRLTRQIEFLEANPDVDLVGAWVLVFRRHAEPFGARRPPTSHEGISERPTSAFLIVHPTYSGKLAWFSRHLYDKRATRSQDQELLLRTHGQSRFANLPEILLGLREESLSIRKNLVSKCIWAKILYGYCLRNGHVLRGLLALGRQAVRTALFCTAFASGMERLIQSRRVVDATKDEVAEWNQVLAMLSG